MTSVLSHQALVCSSPVADMVDLLTTIRPVCYLVVTKLSRLQVDVKLSLITVVPLLKWSEGLVVNLAVLNTC